MPVVHNPRLLKILQLLPSNLLLQLKVDKVSLANTKLEITLDCLALGNVALAQNLKLY